MAIFLITENKKLPKLSTFLLLSFKYWEKRDKEKFDIFIPSPKHVHYGFS